MNLKEKFFDLFNMYVEKKTSKENISKILKKLLPYKIEYDLIRLGDENDGGYLVPNDLDGIVKNYSAGVGKLSKFEWDLKEKFLIDSNMLDYNDIDERILPIGSKFFKKKIGVGISKDELNINNWLNEEKGEIIFKMDIEGDEYLTLASLSEVNLKKMRILVLEIHDLRNLRNYFFFKTFEKIITKLHDIFYVCHLHANNASKIKNIGGYNIPDMLELTLIRKDRVKNFTGEFSKIPHKLDQKTVKKKNEISIDQKWYF
tara:strand:+ start:395 stop:1171 length:777 start_codon:yes stop_codon:yes gene_type:complete